MTLALRVVVAVVPVPTPLPIPTLKQLDASVLKGFSVFLRQPNLAPDYRSGLNICFLLATTSGGWWFYHLKPEAPKELELTV